MAHDAAHAYGKVTTLAGAEFPDVWAVWFRIAVAKASGFHSSLSNLERAIYVLIILYVLFLVSFSSTLQLEIY